MSVCLLSCSYHCKNMVSLPCWSQEDERYVRQSLPPLTSPAYIHWLLTGTGFWAKQKLIIECCWDFMAFLLHCILWSSLIEDTFFLHMEPYLFHSHIKQYLHNCSISSLLQNLYETCCFGPWSQTNVTISALSDTLSRVSLIPFWQYNQLLLIFFIIINITFNFNILIH